MTFKTLEIRDVATHIAAMAIRMRADNLIQDYYLHQRCGHPRDGSSIVLMRLNDMLATNDPYEWTSISGNSRTMQFAHNWIIDHFDDLSDGDVVDVAFNLGETTHKKVSERLICEDAI